MPQVSSQERISERIREQIADAQGSQGILQERVSERIVEQIVPVPQTLPLERISERIRKQTVDVPLPQPIPQERITERIAEPNVEFDPGPSGGSTLRDAAAASAAAECPNDGVFRTFPRRKKSAKIGRGSTAGVIGQSRSWTPAAYQEEEAAFDYENIAERRWSGSEFSYWFFFDGRWRGPVSAPWDM